MTVGELRELLAYTDSDMPVVVPFEDHSYRDADFVGTNALFDKAHRRYHEDYGEKETPEKDFGKRMMVFVVR